MVRGSRAALFLVLLPVALTLAACGGDSSSDQGALSSTGTEAGTTGTGGASGAADSNGATGAATGATGGTGKKSGSRGSGGTSANTGGSSTGSGAAGGTSKPKSDAKARKRPKKPHFLPGAFVGQKKPLYDQAKRVCQALTLEGLAHEYNVTSKTPAAVAHRYAQAYPTKIRDAVYKGCKAGLSK